MPPSSTHQPSLEGVRARNGRSRGEPNRKRAAGASGDKEKCRLPCNCFEGYRGEDAEFEETFVSQQRPSQVTTPACGVALEPQVTRHKEGHSASRCYRCLVSAARYGEKHGLLGQKFCLLKIYLQERERPRETSEKDQRKTTSSSHYQQRKKCSVVLGFALGNPYGGHLPPQRGFSSFCKVHTTTKPKSISIISGETSKENWCIFNGQLPQ